MNLVPMATDSGVLFAVSPDGSHIEPTESIPRIVERKADSPWLWLHLDNNRPATAEWLRAQEDLPEDITESIIERHSRPRCTRWPGGLLFVGRGVNLNTDSRPEDMVSIRAWLTHDRLVTVVLRRVRAAEDVAAEIERGEPIESPGEALVWLVSALLDRMTPIIRETGEEIDALLERIVEGEHGEARSELTPLRQRIVLLRRYAAPLRDAINELHRAPKNLIPASVDAAVTELVDRSTRLVEDLDTHNARAELARQEVASIEAETLNRRLYGLAIISAIFLPLSFLTGLLGMNVPGIPVTTQPWAFWPWVGVFLLSLSVQLFILKKLRWL